MNKQRLLPLILLFVFILTTCGCGGETAPTIADTVMTLPHFEEPVALCHEAALKRFSGNGAVPIADVIASCEKSKTADQPVQPELWFRMNDEGGDQSVGSAVLELAENAAYVNAETYAFPAGQTRLTLTELLPGKTYYYRVTVTRKDGTTVTGEESFSTAMSPRFLALTGVRNARDIGGWETENGKRVAFGKLFRGQEIDGAVEPTYLATEEDISYLRDTLGVRFDCDLRDVAMNTEPGPLGDTVRRVGYGARSYEKVFESVDEHGGYGRDSMRRVFTDLADPENYPMYLHCTYGNDRTGTVCFLLEGLLGVSVIDCVKEYELSALYYGNRDRNTIMALLPLLEPYGDTFQHQVEGYLRSIGITDAQMNTIREIFEVN